MSEKNALMEHLIRIRGVPREDLEHVTSLIAPCMSIFRGARILVTGASGFFGSWLVETFHRCRRAHGQLRGAVPSASWPR
jgi:FlaA1/EpsC-like NDP-sugar epimerase